MEFDPLRLLLLLRGKAEALTDDTRPLKFHAPPQDLVSDVADYLQQIALVQQTPDVGGNLESGDEMRFDFGCQNEERLSIFIRSLLKRSCRCRYLPRLE